MGRASGVWAFPTPELGEEPPKGYEMDAPENRLLFVLAWSREDLDRTLRVLLIGYILMGLGLAVGLVLIIRFAVGRSLLPLNRVANETSAIDPADLTHRFQTDLIPGELMPVCSRLNDLLERLESAFQRERRFNQDVSHELRTPLAELRTLAKRFVPGGREGQGPGAGAGGSD